MNYPDMVLSIASHADCHPDVPVVRQRLRPVRVDFESRRHHDILALHNTPLIENVLADAEQNQHQYGHDCNIEIAASLHRSS